MDGIVNKVINDQDLSSCCLVCCSKVDLNVSDIVANDDSLLIDKNLGIIFLLRKLLIVPDHQLKRNLKEGGNPEEWGIHLCLGCSLLLRQARDLHGCILRIEGKLKEVQKIIVDKTKKSIKPIKNKQGVSKEGRQGEIWRRTREFVKNYNYSDQFENPFKEGDKTAKLIGRKLQLQPSTQAVNLNSVKNEVGGGPSPQQIEVELEGDEGPIDILEEGEDEDDMDWQWEEEDDPLEEDEEEMEIGETKCTRSTGGIQKVSDSAATTVKKVRRAPRPNIIVDGKYKCRYCEEDIFFDKRKACIYHENKHLKGAPLGTLVTRPHRPRICVDGKWQCRHCDQGFDTVKGLHGHEKEKHVSVKGQFICDSCGKAFNSKKYLQGHNYQQHGLLANGAPVQKKEKKREPLVCNICGKTLWSQRGLQNHLVVVHAGIFKFECEYCGRKIPTRTALKKHLLSRHAEEEGTRRMVEEEGVRLWRCEVKGCSRRFMGKGSLDKHGEKVHGGMGKGEGEERRKRFNCGICGKGFWERSKLKRHELIHKKK